MLIILLTAHAGALAALYPAALPVWSKLTMSLLVAVSCWRLCRRSAFLTHPDAVTGIRWDGSETWLLQRRGDREEAVRLLPGSYVHPLLVILLFTNQDGKPVRPVVIMPDMLDGHLFRRLRAKLGVANEKQ